MAEHFYIPQPTATAYTAQGPNGMLPVYNCADFPEMKWSGTMPLPTIGDRVYLRINNIGWGKVEGYCESHGYLGLLVMPEAPPAWHAKQTENRKNETSKARKLGAEKAKIERIREWPEWIMRGVACVFGAEISLEAPEVKA